LESAGKIGLSDEFVNAGRKGEHSRP
jgi:hypothetical protein